MSEEKQEQPPINITQAAIDKIKSMKEKDDKQGCGLRIAVITGGCAGLSYDLRFKKEPYDNDVIFEKDNLRIFINPESVDFLKGTTVDYIDTLKESGFKYTNPNAQSSCGCGTSFS
jgi:iron-sulfur cluster assembly protein